MKGDNMLNFEWKPEEFIAEYGLDELKKTQNDPEYLVRTYIAEDQDSISIETFDHLCGTEIHIKVTEPSGKWRKFKFLKKESNVKNLN